MKMMIYNLQPDETPVFQQMTADMGIEMVYTPEYPSPENIAAMKGQGIEAVNVILCPITRDVLQSMYDVGIRHVSTRSVGFEHIDLDAAEDIGISVTHAMYPPASVAGYAMMLILMCVRKMNQIMVTSAAQNFVIKGKKGRDLSQCTVGIVGTGRIGEAVARRLRPFECKIIAYDVRENEGLKDFVTYVSKDELFEQSDVVTLHAFASKENHHLVGERELSLMKSDAFIVNTARGELIDSEALVKALQENRLGGVGLDVLENEGGIYYRDCTGEVLKNKEYLMLTSMPNCIITPHMAFNTTLSMGEQVKSSLLGYVYAMTGHDNPYLCR